MTMVEYSSDIVSMFAEEALIEEPIILSLDGRPIIRVDARLRLFVEADAVTLKQVRMIADKLLGLRRHLTSILDEGETAQQTAEEYLTRYWAAICLTVRIRSH